MSEPPKPTRVIVNAIEILGPPMVNIIHDLGPDEVVCPVCSGVGMFKTEERSPDRTWHDGNLITCIPWQNQYLVLCQHCYFGKAQLCAYCKKPSRSGSRCQCAGAEANRNRIESEAEERRRATCKHVALDDYEYDHVWAANNDDYILTDDIEQYLSDSPNPSDEVFFACNPAAIDCKQSAESVMENMREASYDQCSDCDVTVEFSSDAETELAEALEEWAQKHCTIPVLYWRDDNLIVDVPDEWRDTENHE